MSARGLILFIALSIFWGIPYLMIKVAVLELSVPFLVCARSIVGSLVLLPFAVYTGGFQQVSKAWIAVVSFTVIEMIIPWGLLAHAEINLTSSTTGLLIAITPVIAIVIARMTGETSRLSPRRLVGLAIGFAGVLTLAAPELGGDFWSIAQVVLAAACYAAGSVIAARWLNNVPPLPMTAVCLILCALAYLPPALNAWPVGPISMNAISAVAGLGTICTAIAFFTFFLLVREIGSERAVIITYVAPAISIAAGVLVLGEPLTQRMIAAFALIICGSYIATLSASAAKSSVTA
ncbi:DMT family transporter [Phyllobacterium sp. YR531]|uniref:DMT family transporter n=1 Tax=Phyllobacterium sp. YR531 TaxID=1144343 RepID=UPI00026F4913|nr:DMT family transporter [Phyllobacterium sp. YR531]EJN05556.1 putative permease [Phyllobacterium sp. YR531]